MYVCVYVCVFLSVGGERRRYVCVCVCVCVCVYGYVMKPTDYHTLTFSLPFSLSHTCFYKHTHKHTYTHTHTQFTFQTPESINGNDLAYDLGPVGMKVCVCVCVCVCVYVCDSVDCVVLVSLGTRRG